MIPFHPLADLFPLIDGSAFDDLVSDVDENGLRELIVIHDGQILDGRNRYRAAVASGRMDPDTGAYRSKWSLYDGFREFGSEAEDGDDPLKWVLSKNLHRRHLSESQRAMVAAKLAQLPSNRPKKGANLHPSAKSAADLLDVSERTVKTAKKVIRDGAKELQAAVDQRRVTVSLAAQLAALPVDEQREIVALADPRAIKAAARKWREADTQAKKSRRTEREAELAKKQTALPDKRYGLIYADPEWRFEPYSRETGMDRAAENHYPTSDLEDIKARDVAAIAADDCVLFLWATAPMLPQAIAVMAAWDFAYKSHVIWRKAELRGSGETPEKRDRGGYSGAVVEGMGYWFRNAHELLLVGTRGKIPAPAMGTQFPSVIDHPPLKHSEKPERFAELIERYFPNLPKIELNRRGPPRAGWDAWGNEAVA